MPQGQSGSRLQGHLVGDVKLNCFVFKGVEKWLFSEDQNKGGEPIDLIDATADNHESSGQELNKFWNSPEANLAMRETRYTLRRFS